MRIVRLVPCMLLAMACGDGKKPSQQPDASPGIDASVDAPDVDIDAAPDAPADAPPDAPPGGNASRVWVIGDFLTDNRREAGAFDGDAATLPFNTANPPGILVPGGATAELFDGQGATANVFDARGGKIAFVADLTVAGRFDLYAAAADGSNPVLLVQGEANIEITSVFLSPDGAKVGFLRDATLDGGFDLFFVTTDGAGTPVKLSPDRPAATGTNAQDVFAEFTWSSNSQFIAFSADLTENGFDQPYVVDTNSATPVAVEILTQAEIPAQAMGAQGVRGRLLFDANNNVYFRARVTANSTQFTLFRSDTAGNETAIALPARGDASEADPGAFGITPDGATLVFSADAPDLGTYNLYTQATVNPQAPVNLTNLTPMVGVTLRADFTTPLFFSPDGTKVAVVANYLGGRMHPFVVNLDGTGTRRLATEAAACGTCDTEKLAWTADSATVFATGDLSVNNVTELYKLDPAQADQTLVKAVEAPTGGDVVNLFVVEQ